MKIRKSLLKDGGSASIKPLTASAYCATFQSMTNTNGKEFKKQSNTTTKIPPSIFAEIVQTRSCPETIAALLNEAEATHSSLPKHWNAKRVYPFWKTCKTCSKPFPCHTKEQATRNLNCPTCVTETVGKWNKGRVKPMTERKGRMVVCPNCGKETWKPDAWLKKSKQAFCSRHCRAVAVTGPILVANKFNRTGMKFPGTGLKGANNPAWKGGVTYFKRKGKYANQAIKYVRCPKEFSTMARKDGYVMEHRLKVAKAIGRPLTRTECVHHVNHDATDNRLENLELFASNRDHKLFEHHGSPDPIWRM